LGGSKANGKRVKRNKRILNTGGGR